MSADTGGQARDIPPAGKKDEAGTSTKRLNTVLDRVSMIKGLVRTGKFKSDQATLRQHWMPDGNSKDCYDCGKAFTTWRRRHHCRVCGQIFCRTCSSEVIAGALLGYNGELRCCNYCSGVIRESEFDTLRKAAPQPAEDTVKSNSLQRGAELAPPPASEAIPIAPRVSSAQPSLPRMSMVESAFSRLGFSGRQGLTEEQLNVVVTKLASAIGDSSLAVANHRDKLVTYEECIVASDFVDWFVGVEDVKRSNAIAVGQQLLDAKYFQHVAGEETTFRDDYILFYPMPSIFTTASGGDTTRTRTKTDTWLEDDDAASGIAPSGLAMPTTQPTILEGREAGLPAGDSPGASGGDMRPVTPIHRNRSERAERHGTLSQPRKLHRPSSSVSLTVGERRESVHPAAIVSDQGSASLPEDAMRHARLFVEQALQREGLSLEWLDVLMLLIESVIRHIRPNVRQGDVMDIRRYVRVKTITGGKRKDSRYFSGANFEKNLTSKKMNKEIRNPRVLLMRFAVEYERVENKYSSLDAVLLQEVEYLQSIVAKILALRPTVVLVGRSVARIAQDLLRDAGVALVVNVKPVHMDYVARCTKADVLRSINELNFEPTLGTCDIFRVRDIVTATGKQRPFVCFEGCDTALGCTIFLRGSADENELKAVRGVLSFGAYVAHSLRLEGRFLQNEFTTVADGAGSLIQKPDAGREEFALALRRTALSTSPGVAPALPYLYSERGARSPVRYLIPNEVLYFRKANTSSVPPNGAKDALLAKNHQEIDVLFACMDSTGFPCDNPRIIKMAYYGVNDLTLGSFLEIYCFEQQQKCCSNPHCGEEDMPMRSFTHKNSRVLIHVETLPQALSVSPEEQRQIFMWSRCKTCDSETPLTKMADDSWSLSLAKYLELTFNGEAYRILPEHACKECGASKSAHWNYYRNFCRGDKIVCFEHQAIEIPELVVPDTKIQFEPYIATIASLTTNLSQSRDAARKLFREIEHRIGAALAELEGLPSSEADSRSQNQRILNDMDIQREQEYNGIVTELDEIEQNFKERFQAGNGSINFGEATELEGLIYDQNRTISAAVTSWNQRMGAQCALFATGKVKTRAPDSSLHMARNVSSVSLKDTERHPSRGGSLSQSKRPHTPVHEPDTASATGSAASEPVQFDSGDGTSRSLVRSASGMFQQTGAHGSQLDAGRRTEDGGEGRAKISVAKKIMDLLQSNSNSNISPLSYPFSDNVHYSGVRIVTGVDVRKDEPSSLIAFALASPEYGNFVEIGRTNGADSAGVPRSSSNTMIKVDDIDDLDEMVTPPTPDAAGAAAVNTGSDVQHFKLQWLDRGTKFTCRVFYAREFRALRQLLHGEGEEGEERFIKSLSRCMRWDPHGGKSKASFCKMTDDRFILKQMSRPEAQSSLEFMPEYIKYISEAHATNKPTVLAKILGIFSIRYSVAGNIQMEQDVLIIENLFAGRQLSITFDLKGSMRSRYAHRTGKRGDVLLDENLLEYICDRPLYLRKHCKWVMEAAIENDSTFLSSNGVMDYSLLLGIDDEHKVLVVGIIDYIRTFTWDKKLEMYVKRTGILGGSGNLPTVISPRMYKERFIDQMDKYFLCVPDRWHHLSVFNHSRKSGSPTKPDNKAGGIGRVIDNE